MGKIVELICHVKSSVSQTEPLNYEASVWQIILFGRCLLLCAMQLAAVFIRTSYTISRGSITLHEFPVIKAR